MQNNKNQKFKTFTNQDGMRYPSIDLLLEQVDSKYKLVYIASRVASEIEKEHLIVKDAKCHKPVGIALEEIINHRVKVKFQELEEK